MAGCRQAPSHYLSQCWPRSLSPYGVTRPQSVLEKWHSYPLKKSGLFCTMMTSSNGNIFRVTGPLCGEFTGPGEFPSQRPVTRSFDVFFDLHLNKRLSKQSRGWRFETPSRPLWRHCNENRYVYVTIPLSHSRLWVIYFLTFVHGTCTIILNGWYMKIRNWQRWSNFNWSQRSTAYRYRYVKLFHNIKTVYVQLRRCQRMND